jgi:hypothetical protein
MIKYIFFFLILNILLIFINSKIVNITSHGKIVDCFFDENFNFTNIYEISLTNNNNSYKKNYHNFLLYIDYNNLKNYSKNYSVENINKIITLLKDSQKILNKLFLSHNTYKYFHNLPINDLCLKEIYENKKYIQDFAQNSINDLIIVPYFKENEKFINNKVLGNICLIEQFTNRPILGYLEINPEKIRKIKLNTILHQIFHIMGFNYKLLNENFNIYKSISYSLLGNNVEKNIINFPSCLNVLEKIVGKKSLKYNKIFINRLKDEKLKSIEFSSHWFSKIYIKDIMNIYKRKRIYINEIILAYFFDTNWYRSDMSLCNMKNFKEVQLEENTFEFYIEKANIHCFINNHNKRISLLTKFTNFPYELIPKIYKISNNLISKNIILYNNKIIDKKLDKIKNQHLTMVLTNPEKCKCYPSTVFFKYDPNFVPENKEIKNFTLKEIDINIPEYMVIYKPTNRKHEHDAVLPVFFENNIIQVNNEYENNAIFKRYFGIRPIENLMKNIHSYQIYNHFLLETELCHKDRLYYHYMKFKNLFPEDFNYHPESFKLPQDKELVEEKFKNYKAKKNNIWIKKPEKGSLGVGIKFIYNYNDIPSNGFITQFINNPHLLYGTKYHIRLYVLITGYSPMKLYLFNEGQVMRAAQKYDDNLDKLKRKEAVLTNLHITGNSKSYIHDIDFDSEKGSEWSVSTLKKYFIKNNIDFDNVIWSQVKDIAIKTQMTIQNEEMKVLKLFSNIKNRNIFQFYGIDVMLDDKLKVWLLEYNQSPFLELYNIINKINKKKLIADIYNLIGIVPFAHDGSEKLYENLKCNYSNSVEEAVNEALCEFSRPQGGFERIFPTKKTLSKYKKFFLYPNEENLKLWEIIEKNDNI